MCYCCGVIFVFKVFPHGAKYLLFRRSFLSMKIRILKPSEPNNLGDNHCGFSQRYSS